MMPAPPDVSFCFGLALGLAVGLLIFLPWCRRLDRELDAVCERYNELFEAARETFDLPPWIGKARRR